MNYFTNRTPGPVKSSGVDLRNVCILAYANGFTSWHYRAGLLTIAEVCEPGFFVDADHMFSEGDMLTISAVDGVGQFGIGESLTLTPVVTAPIQHRETGR